MADYDELRTKAEHAVGRVLAQLARAEANMRANGLDPDNIVGYCTEHVDTEHCRGATVVHFLLEDGYVVLTSAEVQRLLGHGTRARWYQRRAERLQRAAAALVGELRELRHGRSSMN